MPVFWFILANVQHMANIRLTCYSTRSGPGDGAPRPPLDNRNL